jgi:O-antigen ligase
MDIKNSIKNANVKTVLAHSLVFLLPFLTLISKHGVGACSFGFLLLAGCCYRDAGRTLSLHYAQVRGVLATFLYGFLFAGLVVLLDADISLRFWEKPSRMLFAATAMLAVLVLRPNRKTLWHGLVAGAVAGASLAVYQRWMLGIDRPGGDINAITFGDIVLCMGLMSLAGVLDFPRRQRWWPLLGAVAGHRHARRLAGHPAGGAAFPEVRARAPAREFCPPGGRHVGHCRGAGLRRAADAGA